MTTQPGLSALIEAGLTLWIDDLRRSQLHDGELAGLIRDGVTGVTSNPSIVESALSKDPAYREQLNTSADQDTEEQLWTVLVQDVQQACDLLADTHRRSGGRDGLVSLEVSPRLAHDEVGTVAAAQTIWTRVNRPNLLVKVPATPAGVGAMAVLISEGININATLIFSLDQYRAVENAYFCGLEKAVAQGRDVRTIHATASVFVSRFDRALDPQLAQASPDHPALGLTGVVNAALIADAHATVLGTPRWATLADDGGHPLRLLWASTGVKGDHLPPTHYLTHLAYPGTIATVPPATLEAARQLTPEQIAAPLTADQAASLLDQVAAAGVDYCEVTSQLLEEGLHAFDSSWTSLLSTLTSVATAPTP